MDFYLTTSASPFPCFQITWMTIYYSEQNRPDKSLCVNVLRNCCRNTRIYQIARTKSENLLASSSGSASYKNSVAHIKKERIKILSIYIVHFQSQFSTMQQAVHIIGKHACMV